MIENNQGPLVKNYLYNTVTIVLNILLPLITFPYVGRILGPDGIGKVSFANSYVSYFIMIASIGIPVYGIKEVAKARDDKTELSKIFFELFIINCIFMLIATALYLPSFIIVEKIRNDIYLYMIVGSSLILNVFSIDYFYSGIEEYKYIAIRNIVFKVIYIILLFLLIREKGDYLYYAAISVISIFGANVLNIINLKNHLVKVNFLNLKRHLKPMTFILLAGIVGSVYQNLDTLMLGLIAGDTYVGFYSIDRKLTQLGILVTSSLGIILIPRLSYYLSKNMIDEYNEIAEKSINFIYFIALPSVVLLIIFAEEILTVFGGPDFAVAAWSLQIIAPQMLATSLTTFIGFQILLPNNMEKEIMLSNIFGAIVNFTINIMLIKYFMHNATSLAISVSESIVFLTQLFLAKKYITFRIINRESFTYFIAAGLVTVAMVLVKIFIPGIMLMLISGLFLGGFIYILILYLRNDYFIMMVYSKIIR